MDSAHDATLSPYEDAESGVIAEVAPTAIPMDKEVKKILVCINKGVRDAQNGYDKYVNSVPKIALEFQKNMITLMKLQLEAVRTNFELQGGKVSQPTSVSSTTNQTLVLTHDARANIANLLSGQGLLGATTRAPVAEPFARDSSGGVRE